MQCTQYTQPTRPININRKRSANIFAHIHLIIHNRTQIDRYLINRITCICTFFMLIIYAVVICKIYGRAYNSCECECEYKSVCLCVGRENMACAIGCAAPRTTITLYTLSIAPPKCSLHALRVLIIGRCQHAIYISLMPATAAAAAITIHNIPEMPAM